MWTILIVLFILWILGFSFEIAGNLIHILLVIALVLFIFRLIKGRKA
ncbi:lmo0937 family membrane protein [Alkalihalophilus sp. As8PL]|uniref:Lmo0937 family membrane protein n=1 Tax=Alkalihalophilus sp. As8PL TaxID=3237103 RepID=A0AB39BQU9_9BACI